MLSEKERAEIDVNAKLLNKEHELGELRSTLKMKIFELTSLGMVFEERTEQLRRKDTENGMLNDQVAVLKVSFMRRDVA